MTENCKNCEKNEGLTECIICNDNFCISHINIRSVCVNCLNDKILQLCICPDCKTAPFAIKLVKLDDLTMSEITKEDGFVSQLVKENLIAFENHLKNTLKQRFGENFIISPMNLLRIVDEVAKEIAWIEEE